MSHDAPPQSAPSEHAVYPGSFDVLTLGHLDIIRRAARMFPRVTVAVAYNPLKTTHLFTPDERVAMIRQACREFPNIHADHFEGLTVQYCQRVQAGVILRGLRAVSDFEFELQMAMTNENLAPDVTTIFMAAAPQYSFISSTLVKELARLGGEVRDFVPSNVAAALRERLLGPQPTS